MNRQLSGRLAAAKDIARDAGSKAHGYFRSIGDLVVQSKGVQDMVSNADLDVENFVRERLLSAYPDDGIVGEEHGRIESRSGYTWVIDPIDGTANFVAGIPSWCVILACVHEDATRIGVIFDPCSNELYWAMTGGGAWLNDHPLRVANPQGLNIGSTGVGMNARTPGVMIVRFMEDLIDRGGIFYRNASGGLMLSYVAAGRLIGYVEPHMNAWDCLAGQLLIAEAGGCVEQQSANDMLKVGGRVIASGPNLFEELKSMADRAFAG